MKTSSIKVSDLIWSDREYLEVDRIEIDGCSCHKTFFCHVVNRANIRRTVKARDIDRHYARRAP